MNAIEIVDAGPQGRLRLTERPQPTPGPGEVLIKVAAAGVNRPDLMQVRGLYPPPPGASDLPGLEVAGQIVALGQDVHPSRLGQSVCALVTGGGYAEYCLAAATLCLPQPDTLTLVEAAAVPEAVFTVWHNVFERGRLGPGETLLVQGGTSGIGTMAIQLARQWGARVIATAGTDDKCAALEALGAEAIHYRDEDFKQRVLTLTDGAGVNVILDIIGGPYFQAHLDLLAADGRLLIIAVQGGPKTTASLLPILLKRLTVTGSTLRPRSLVEKTRLAEAVQAQVWPWLNTGQIRPIIQATYPLADAERAHALMASSTHIGKIILTLDP